MFLNNFSKAFQKLIAAALIPVKLTLAKSDHETQSDSIFKACFHLSKFGRVASAARATKSNDLEI